MALLEHLDLLMFAVTCVFLMCGYPVAFTLAGSALFFALIGMQFGLFDASFLTALPQRIFGTMTNQVLIAVPLFVFMGVMLERSKVAEELLESMGKLFGSLRGGLGISVCIVGALLAASTGIVGATVVTMGLLSLPTMLRRNYDTALATGTIAAAGTLGQIIPPSIVLVLLGDVISSAYQKAQLEQGIFSPEAISVGDLFAGALLPGLMLVGLYISYIIFVAITKPSAAPAIPREELVGRKGLFVEILQALIPPIVLIVSVLGSILAGIATPTEAAAVGAIGALFLAGYRAGTSRTLIPQKQEGEGGMEVLQGSRAAKQTQPLNAWPVLIGASAIVALLTLNSFYDLRLGRENLSNSDNLAIVAAFILCGIAAGGILVCLLRTFRIGILQEVMRSTTQITSMVFVILIGAALFSLVFRGLGGDDTVRAFLNSMPGGKVGAMVSVMLIMFFLGFFLDFIEITFVVVPLVAPALLMMDISPIWLGVMMAVNLQTSFLTPPFGFALFYLRGVAPPEVRTIDIYRGAVPFVFIQIFALIILSVFPEIATWLPSKIMG